MVPLGKPIRRAEIQESELLYDEYVVYNVEQVCMRYLVKVVHARFFSQTNLKIEIRVQIKGFVTLFIYDENLIVSANGIVRKTLRLRRYACWQPCQILPLVHHSFLI